MAEDNNDLEARIRERAYVIWLAEGCPAGRAAEHWRRAEQEIRSEGSQTREGVFGPLNEIT
jgi:hypothetical protein